MHTVSCDGTLDGFRAVVRALLAEARAPDSVTITEARASQRSLFSEPAPSSVRASETAPAPVALSRAMVSIIELVLCHRDPARLDALYRVVYRFAFGDRRVLERETDPDVRALRLYERALRRDIHKMHAFVRFRLARGEPERYVAFYEPDHRVLRRAIEHFVSRFGDRDFSIFTPDESAHYRAESRALSYDAGAQSEGDAWARAGGIAEDEAQISEQFQGYFRSVFNPARVAERAMVREMPRRFWKHLPEAQLVPALLAEAREREDAMIRDTRAKATVREHDTLDDLRARIEGCVACSASECGTRALLGRGDPRAQIAFVGECPGDHEDQQGAVFVGPAGQLLDALLREALIDPPSVYLSNAVKHFQYTGDGKLRLHKSPTYDQAVACKPWLDAELALVRPRVVVCLGQTAAQSFLGRGFRLTQQLGQWIAQPWFERMLATFHPAAALRMTDASQRARVHAQIVSDLRRAREALCPA